MSITRGWSAMKQMAENSLEYVKFAPNDSKLVRIAVEPEEIIGVWEHTEKFNEQWKTVTCLGKQVCPLCKAGYQATYRVYIPVIEKGDANMKVKIWKISGKANNKIMDLAEELAEDDGKKINEVYIKVVRTGQGIKTEYSYFAKNGVTEDLSVLTIPDIESKLQPKTVEELEHLLSFNTAITTDDAESPFV